ncbi:conserved hypothetical protein [Pyrenophora tritici-repentis Pt-1C-BFP]|uniref:Uncharacterized protein n=1 Tax=Pyrenophora tritici-repentis (strain Pt-1C-BFP) TaxID=426418 RepID=B2W2A2_PYRTR|nr:uncharacterized protein PTRG_03550 [Pyrenophora tritici-repentis Pt-1C-BFP]EDU46388.1 conserved hypothetical protein [Pyrenophora tritici-repentis Pt-1C-BFP]
MRKHSRRRDDCNDDPDIALPSTEHEILSTSSHETTPSTSSTVMHERVTQQIHDQDYVQEQLDAVRDLRLTSLNMSETPLQRTISTPSIHVTPLTPGIDRGSRNDSLVAEFENLQTGSHDTASIPVTSRSCETLSPSPARPRRSGSGITRRIHRVEDEEPPAHLTQVEQHLSDVRTQVLRMAQVLSSSKLHLENGSTIQGLHQQALDLAALQLPSSRIVGLIGDSGVGKSSLINSLLDKVDLARASNNGTACTSAVTEYMFHERDDFTIHVDYFTLHELRRQFEELLRAHRDYQSLLKAPKSNGGDEEGESGGKALRRKADLATQTFQAIFREKLHENPNALSSMEFDRAVGLMVDWASALLPRLQGQQSFGTIERCSARLRELTSDSIDPSNNSVSQTRWPFIRKICVYLNAYILSKGLIIADLPGLRDQNSARKAITERYVRQCHQIFAVTRIDRAMTDESIKEIFELARRANLSKIDVVCTRSEDVQMREAKHDWIGERARIEELQKKIHDYGLEVDSKREDIDNFERDQTNLTREEEHDLRQLEREYRKAQRSKENNEFELRTLVIGLRNAKVSDGLLEQYREHPIATTLRTFCVSNTTYWDHREKPTLASIPYLVESGIIGLRKYCIGIVADSRLRVSVEVIKVKVPAFLGSVKLWVEAGSSSWYHSSYKAFCSNYGDYSTGAIGYRCWNEEAIHHMKTDMVNVWTNLALDLEVRVQDLLGAIADAFENVLGIVSSQDEADSNVANIPRPVVQTLFETLNHRKDLALYGTEDAIEEFHDKLLELKTDALAPVQTAFIGRYMQDTYHAANMEYGSGSDRRRKTLMTGAFGSVHMFNDQRRACKADFRDIACSLQKKVNESIRQQVQLIEADLQILKDGNTVLESERDPDFRSRVEAELKLVKEKVDGARSAVHVLGM